MNEGPTKVSTYNIPWRKGSARALETQTDIVFEQGFTGENRGPQHVRAYLHSDRDCVKSLRLSYTGLYDAQNLAHKKPPVTKTLQ